MPAMYLEHPSNTNVTISNNQILNYSYDSVSQTIEDILYRMQQLHVFHLDQADDLIYRGEGNSSLVVALQSNRQVLRILKSDAKKLKNDKDILTLLLQHVDFNTNILPRFIPQCYFSLPKLVQLERKDLQFIRKLVQNQRPYHRLTKTITDCEYVLLMPDYCTLPKSIQSKVDSFGSVLSVEIKPKSGFLPSPSLFADLPMLSLRSEICRYGLAQFYKFRRELIHTISDYCPLDLFSGCRVRAANAMLALIHNPQNNFRVFSDCQLVYADKYGGAEADLARFIDVLDNFFDFKIESQPSELLKLFSDLLVDALYDNACFNELSKADFKQGDRVDLLEELEKLETGDQGSSFFLVFIQMFDRTIRADIETPPIASDNDFSDVFLLPPLTGDDIDNNTLVDFDEDSKSPKSCRLHQASSVRCSKDCEHTLPNNSVMHSILQAQKLDHLDSVRAVKIYRTLSERFELLKTEHVSASYIKLIRLFVTENLEPLKMLWQFLISLTAKDCSIMLAMQQIVPGMQRPEGVRIVKDKKSGAEFVCSISITDLDYKQAYKIERMLRNDTRMVAAMLDSKKTVPGSTASGSSTNNGINKHRPQNQAQASDTENSSSESL